MVVFVYYHSLIFALCIMACTVIYVKSNTSSFMSSPTPSPMLNFHRLMDQIYSATRHYYVLHVDIKSDKRLIKAINNDYCRVERNQNCRSIKPRNIGWGGLTTGEMMIDLMREAVEWYDNPYNSSTSSSLSPPQFEYFILIGHESIPIASLNYIEGFLSSSLSDSSSLSSPSPSPSPSPSSPSTNLTLSRRDVNFMNCWRVDGYDFFGQWEDQSWRLRNVVVDSFDGWLLENIEFEYPKGSDQYVSAERPGTLNGDYGDEDGDGEGGDGDGDGVVFYKSIQLVTLSRDAVKYIVYGPETKRFMLFLANVKTSDEMILPTILLNHPTRAFTHSTACDTTLHFTYWVRPGGSWHPEILTIEHLPLLLNTTRHLFARKIHPQLSYSLLQAIDRVVREARQEFRDEDDIVPLLQRREYVNTMTWLLPLAAPHLSVVFSDEGEDDSVKKIILKSGILTYSEKCVGVCETLTQDIDMNIDDSCDNSSCAEKMEMKPAKVLEVLNDVRAARDLLKSQQFLEYIEFRRQQHLKMQMEMEMEMEKEEEEKENEEESE